MTPDQMRDALQGAYGRVIRTAGGRYPLEVPAGVTAQAWEQKLDVPDEGPAEYLEAKAEGLAMVGLYYGCDTFARITVQDRPAAQRKSSAGKAINVRKRQVIVRALGWREEAH